MDDVASSSDLISIDLMLVEFARSKISRLVRQSFYVIPSMEQFLDVPVVQGPRFAFIDDHCAVHLVEKVCKSSNLLWNLPST